MEKRPLKRILYIEDEPDIAEIAKMVLEDMADITLLCCYSGGEALKKAPAFKPDLFIIDVMMPEMDGPTTLKELHQLEGLSSIPVIFMTAKAQAAEIKEYLNMGALGIIAKPFDPLKLPETITKIWNGQYE